MWLFRSGCFLGLFIAGLAGCGYQWEATGKPRNLDISSLSIPLVKAPSSMLGFEGEFSRVVRREFVSHSRIPIVDRGSASACLEGTITEVRTDPYSYRLDKTQVNGLTGTLETTNARWLTVRLEARLVEMRTGKLLWEDRELMEREVFLVSSDPLSTEAAQKKALGVIAERLAERLYLMTMEQF